MAGDKDGGSMSEDRDMLARRLLQDYDAARDDLAVLTSAQREALTLAAKGYPYADAGKLIGVSHTAIRSRLTQATKRLGCTMPEAIALAAKAGWV
jgi:DNA-directed RNA polymerase specialized sigma24 family protein